MIPPSCKVAFFVAKVEISLWKIKQECMITMKKVEKKRKITFKKYMAASSDASSRVLVLFYLHDTSFSEILWPLKIFSRYLVFKSKWVGLDKFLEIYVYASGHF